MNILWQKLVVVVGFLISMNISLFSQTNLSAGNVYGIWTKANSPYLITGNIMVPDDSVLLIEPGVTIRMDGDFFLNVEGTLLAIGTPNDSITFIANDNLNLKGIKFNNNWSGAAGNMDNNDTSRISYCKIIMEQISFNSFSKVIFSHNRISNCGDIGINVWHNSDILIADNQISNCKEQGIWCYESNPLIINNLITKCGITGIPQNGGAIEVQSCSPRIINNIITDNVAQYGGGIGCLYLSSPILLNNTICNNKATINGGGVSAYGAANPIILNCILWNNKTNDDLDQFGISDNAPIIKYCDIQGGISDIDGFDEHGYNPNFFGQYENNIDLDPKFRTNLSPIYLLEANSPCIDQGIPDTSGLNLPSTDFLKQARITNSFIDMGAVEFQGIPENHPPVLEKINEENILPGASVIMKVNFFDIDRNDTHIITITSDSENVLIQDFTGNTSGSTYRISTADGWKGSAKIMVSVKDNKNGSDSYSYDLNVFDQVCGQIYGITRWNTDTVYVTCDVVIQDNACLFIDPGTVVKVTNHSKIDIYGKLLAIGTLADTILFTTPDSTGFSNYYSHLGWNGLKFHNNQKDTSVLKFCRFEYGRVENFENSWNSEDNSGGAVFISDYKNVIIENSTFFRNYARLSGGAIYLCRTNAEVKNNKISRNRTYSSGTIYTSQSKSRIISNDIIFNSAGNGGGISCSDSVIISGNIISNNKITECAAKGGGIFCKGNPVITNNIICNNTAVPGGGCSNVGGGVYFFDASPVFSNNIIAYNEGDRGGAITSYNSYFTMQNCIIWGNSIYETIEGFVKFDHCIFNGTTSYGLSFDNTILDLDPGFKDPPEGAGVGFDGYKADWSLSDTSYSINTGNPGTDITQFPTDIIGNSRIIHEVIDLGPYEYNQQVKNRRPVISKIDPLHLPSNSVLHKHINIWDPDQNQSHIITATCDNPDLKVETISNDTTAILRISSLNNWKGNTLVHLTVMDNSESENATASQQIEVIVNDSICGNISEDTFWGADTVHISCDITLQDNVTLTVLPGTCIEFNDFVSFEVIGSVRALGTASQPIIFTASNYDNGWNGIMYKNGFYAYTHPADIMNDNDSTLFDYCVFEYCSGEVLFIDDFSKIKISNSDFRHNKMSTIHTYEASPIILHNRFTWNDGDNNYSTIWCERYSDPLISGNFISNNASFYESIIFCDYHSTPSIINNLITFNQSKNGTIQCYSSNPLMINNTIAGNTSEKGGGIYCTYSSPVLTNMILWNNKASQNGNEIYAYGNSPQIQRSVISNSTNDIYLNQASMVSMDFYTFNPQFVDSMSDFQLKSNSPCINTGIIQTGWYDMPMKDISGNDRIVDSLIDMGAYEFHGVMDEISPIDLFIDGGSVYENSPIGTRVGNFSALDPNRNDTHKYQLVSIDGPQNDNADFYISGDTLKCLTVLDYETTPVRLIVVKVTDNTEKDYTGSFTIAVKDRNEKPELLNPIPDINIKKGVSFVFKIPENTFSRDQYDFLTYDAHLAETVNSLPTWLNLDAYRGEFSGTPNNLQTYEIIVFVRDFQFTSEPDTFRINVIATTDIVSTEEIWNDISVFPNPGTGLFYISHSSDKEVQFTVFDLSGRTLIHDLMAPGSTPILIDLSGYTEGLYILKLSQNNSSKVFKLLKK